MKSKLKAKELRVGNLIQTSYGETMKVWQIGDASDNKWVSAESESNPVSMSGIEKFKAIPLTEEWLLNFWFEKDNKHKFYTKGKFILRHDFVLCDVSIRIVVTTVHQLQNLYFALTGQELTINSPVVEIPK